jgi:hypothetical protein
MGCDAKGGAAGQQQPRSSSRGTGPRGAATREGRGGGRAGGGTASAPEMMPSTEGRLRISHSVVIHDSEPVAAEIWVLRQAMAARTPADPADPLPRVARHTARPRFRPPLRVRRPGRRLVLPQPRCAQRQVERGGGSARRGKGQGTR